MSRKRKYSVMLVPDSECEDFKKSTCDCNKCIEINKAQLEWDTFKVETRLQKNMKDVIYRIESRIKAGWDENISKIPTFLG